MKVISVWNSRGRGELDYIRRVWLWASFAFLTRYQQDLKCKWTECKVRAGYTQSENCTFGGNYIQTDFGKHIAFCHLELAWRCYCLCVWCTLPKGTNRDYNDHVQRMHEVPLSVGLAMSAKLFPVWTFTSINTLFFSRVASPLDSRVFLCFQDECGGPDVRVGCV